ncbi:basic secretory protein-like protein [Colwellia psychrerythraea]|uniref:PKD domain protein n=1 Tax=Colwellia psychrerythraea (strain 34H / ATCC BAA-681) TaxID=167879 RepID=Q481A1_COLP3|nr:basic secretory protein-like protein [Colwellia psychrerythraea]AAZ28315.1 PKD domain protein [Colwellia psychrerythraea 34H]
MKNFKLSLIAIVVLSTTLAGCNGSDKSLEITPKKAESVTASSALRNMAIDSGNTISSPDGVNVPGGEGINNLIDGNDGSKFLSFSDSVSVEFSAAKPYALKGYALISGNDAPERDPAEWTVEGSGDGTIWVEIDSRSGQTFGSRGEKRTFEMLTNEVEYQHYRFSFANNPATAAGIFQLAEIELTVVADAPLVDFASNISRAEIGENVQFWDRSLANPTGWQWTFEDGEPATSTNRNPAVTFTSLGAKSVTLVASNDKGSNEKVQEQVVHIWDSQNPWAGYVKPTVTLVAHKPEHEGQIAFSRVMPDIEAVIHDISLQIVKVLYKDVAEAPLFKTVTFETDEYDFPAAKSGTDEDMILMMDVAHLANKAAEGDDALRDEVIGMLWHELTHGYNNSPNSGEYATGDEYHSYLESLANYMRIKAGFHESRRVGIKWVDNWNVDAYEQTSFFLEWVANSHRSVDFIYLFNKAAGDLKEWSFEAAFKSIFGEDKGVSIFWQEYHDAQGIEPPYPTPVDGYRNFAVDEGVSISTNATTVIIPDWDAYEGEDKLIDNNVTKKFNAFIEGTWWLEEHASHLFPINDITNVEVTFELPDAIVLHKYSVTTGNDNPQRDPTLWTISGSVDGEVWTQLDSDNYPSDPERLITFHYDIDDAVTAYKYYQFVFENTQPAGDSIGGDNGRLVQIGEIALLTEE